MRDGRVVVAWPHHESGLAVYRNPDLSSRIGDIKRGCIVALRDDDDDDSKGPEWIPLVVRCGFVLRRDVSEHCHTRHDSSEAPWLTGSDYLVALCRGVSSMGAVASRFDPNGMAAVASHLRTLALIATRENRKPDLQLAEAARHIVEGGDGCHIVATRVPMHQIGTGATAAVQFALLAADGTVVTAKTFLPRYGAVAAREAALLKHCQGHPGVLATTPGGPWATMRSTCLDVDEPPDITGSLITPYVTGWTLQIVATAVTHEGITAAELGFIVRSLLLVLVHLHERCGVAHRDIAPRNVVLRNDGSLLVMDFGGAAVICRVTGEVRDVVMDSHFGTPGFAQPAAAPWTVDARQGDLYAVAMIAQRLIDSDREAPDSRYDSSLDTFLAALRCGVVFNSARAAATCGDALPLHAIAADASESLRCLMCRATASKRVPEIHEPPVAMIKEAILAHEQLMIARRRRPIADPPPQNTVVEELGPRPTAIATPNEVVGVAPVTPSADAASMSASPIRRIADGATTRTVVTATAYRRTTSAITPSRIGKPDATDSRLRRTVSETNRVPAKAVIKPTTTTATTPPMVVGIRRNTAVVAPPNRAATASRPPRAPVIPRAAAISTTVTATRKSVADARVGRVMVIHKPGLPPAATGRR